jgi:protein arginine N-methyltransferase 1
MPKKNKQKGEAQAAPKADAQTAKQNAPVKSDKPVEKTQQAADKQEMKKQTDTKQQAPAATPVDAKKDKDDKKDEKKDGEKPKTLILNGKWATITDAELEAKSSETSADYYFDSYSHFGIHEEMLKDKIRTRSYQQAIINNKHLFKDKVVLDVGCGTGILCMFAAKAGAKHVFGVECAGIVHSARKIIRDNGFEDTITLIKGKIEEIDLPLPKVDIIISEWMGYFLLYESMLDTVLFARDKWLQSDGLLFPDQANMYLCAIEDAEYRADKIDFWDSVYGFNMSCIKNTALIEPLVDVCDPQQVISNSSLIMSIDLYTVKKEDLDFTAPFQLILDKNEYCHALVSYFDVTFSKTHNKVSFGTGPKDKYTHWKQTVFYLEEEMVGNEGDVVQGTISVKRNGKNPRDIDIAITCSKDGKNPREERTQQYRLR